jgi:uncharacterized protein YidB (DUF937 family)
MMGGPGSGRRKGSGRGSKARGWAGQKSGKRTISPREVSKALKKHYAAKYGTKKYLSSVF